MPVFICHMKICQTFSSTRANNICQQRKKFAKESFAVIRGALQEDIQLLYFVTTLPPGPFSRLQTLQNYINMTADTFILKCYISWRQLPFRRCCQEAKICLYNKRILFKKRQMYLFINSFIFFGFFYFPQKSDGVEVIEIKRINQHE